MPCGSHVPSLCYHLTSPALHCRYSVFTVISISVPAKITGTGIARCVQRLALRFVTLLLQGQTLSLRTSRRLSTTLTRTMSCRSPPGIDAVRACGRSAVYTMACARAGCRSRGRYF